MKTSPASLNQLLVSKEAKLKEMELGLIEVARGVSRDDLCSTRNGDLDHLVVGLVGQVGSPKIVRFEDCACFVARARMTAAPLEA